MGRCVCSSLLFLLPALLFTACSTAPTREGTGRGVFPGDQSHLLKGQEAIDYKEIRALFNKGSFEALIPKATAYERKYAKGAQISHVYNFHGLAYLLTRRPVESMTLFRKAAAVAPHPVFKEYVLYNLAAAQFDAGLIEEAALTLSQIRPETFDRDTRVKFHTLHARLFLKQGKSIDAARETLLAARLVDPTVARTAYGLQLDQAIQGIADLDELENLFRNHEDAPVVDGVLYRLGSLEISQGKIGTGERRLKRIIDDYPDSPRYQDARQLLEAVRNQNVVDSYAVGVLLPLSGKYAQFGQKALNAIQLAFRVFNTNEPESKATLIIQDSGDDGATATQGLNTLFFKHHVVGVIGPLLSKGIDQVTKRAQELGVPIITLTQQPGIKGEYVFSGGVTPRVQALEIARHAIEELGLKRFAILHPQDRFGEEYTQAYWDALTELGGQVTGVESYRSGETDFRQVIDRLVGTFYTDARQRELDELAKLREENNVTRRNRKTEQYYALKPIIGFDAVFIPDEPKIVGQILPTFAYRDVDGIQFLGIATWNSPDLLVRAQGHAEGARFVDAFNPKSESPEVLDFLNRFRATFEQEPGQIEANAYDVANVLTTLIDQSKPLTRIDLRDALNNVENFPGVTGRLSSRNGSFVRKLTVLTVKGNRFVSVK